MNYQAKTEFNLDPLKILEQVLSGSCIPASGIEIQSSKVIRSELTMDPRGIKLTISAPEPLIIVTKFLKFKAKLDYIIVGEKEILVKAQGWPELSIDLKAK